MIELLDEQEVENRLLEVPGWRLEGATLRREYVLKDFAAAMVFVNQVAELAEEAKHHPDIHIRWNRVRLFLSTHSKGGITNLDFDLAAQIEELPQEI